MPWGVAVSAAVGLYGANQQAGAAKDAANAQGAGSAASIAEQRRQYDQNRQDQQPWMNAGQNALQMQQNFLAGDYSNALASPDYMAAYEQGMKALDRSAAARGGLMGGGADADRIAYGQQLATQQIGNYWNKLAGLSGTGQQTAQSLGAAGQNFANQFGQNTMNAANARASSYGQRADAYGQAAASVGGAFNNWWGQRQGQQVGGYGGFTPQGGMTGGYGGLGPSNGNAWNFGP